MKSRTKLGIAMVTFLLFSQVSCTSGNQYDKPTDVPNNSVTTYSKTPTNTRSIVLRDTELHNWLLPESRIYGINWSPGGDKFVVLTSSGVTMYDANTYQAIWSIPQITHASVFMPDGKSLILYIYSSGFQVRDTQTGQLLTEKSDNYPPDCFRFEAHDAILSSDGNTLYLSVEDQSDKRVTFTEVHVWNMRSLQCEGAFLRTEGQARSLDLSTDGKFLILSVGLNTSDSGGEVSEDGQVTVWDLEINRRACSIGHQGSIARFKPGSPLLFVSDPKNNQLAFWDMNTCQMVGALNGITTRYNLAFSPDGQILAVWSDGIFILDPNSGKVLANISDPEPNSIFPTDRLSSILSISPDGGFLIYAVHQFAPPASLIYLWKLGK